MEDSADYRKKEQRQCDPSRIFPPQTAEKHKKSNQKRQKRDWLTAKCSPQDTPTPAIRFHSSAKGNCKLPGLEPARKNPQRSGLSLPLFNLRLRELQTSSP
ncbi:hypothetical protein, partial [uncultured Oscillibacter sp.]|uniref:hypothetical protein n=1 Tax=uncultured Oscillibacter sp. TaxID=876091 RepID=UPI0026384E56